MIPADIDCFSIIGIQQFPKKGYISVHGIYTKIPREVSNCTNLKEFNALGNNIIDISGLSNCINLERLCLNQNKITDISALLKCVSILKLDISNNHIKDISVIPYLVNLRKLDMWSNEIVVLPNLGTCSQLMSISLHANPIKSVSKLKYCTKLEQLEISINIDVLISIIKCKSLKELTIRGKLKMPHYYVMWEILNTNKTLEIVSPNIEYYGKNKKYNINMIYGYLMQHRLLSEIYTHHSRKYTN